MLLATRWVPAWGRRRVLLALLLAALRAVAAVLPWVADVVLTRLDMVLAGRLALPVAWLARRMEDPLRAALRVPLAWRLMT